MSLSAVARILIKDYALWNIDIWARVTLKSWNYSLEFSDMSSAIKWLHSQESDKFI